MRNSRFIILRSCCTLLVFIIYRTLYHELSVSKHADISLYLFKIFPWLQQMNWQVKITRRHVVLSYKKAILQNNINGLSNLSIQLQVIFYVNCLGAIGLWSSKWQSVLTVISNTPFRKNLARRILNTKYNEQKVFLSTQSPCMQILKYYNQILLQLSEYIYERLFLFFWGCIYLWYFTPSVISSVHFIVKIPWKGQSH